MKIYLAARYSQKEEIKYAAEELRKAGHVITASWLKEPHAPDTTLDQLTDEDKRYYAEQDEADIERAHLFVIFSVDPLLPTVRGGHNFEMGYARGLGKPIYVVGPKGNIFHYLPGVKHFSCVSELIDGIKGEGVKN